MVCAADITGYFVMVMFGFVHTQEIVGLSHILHFTRPNNHSHTFKPRTTSDESLTQSCPCRTCRCPTCPALPTRCWRRRSWGRRSGWAWRDISTSSWRHAGRTLTWWVTIQCHDGMWSYSNKSCKLISISALKWNFSVRFPSSTSADWASWAAPAPGRKDWSRRDTETSGPEEAAGQSVPHVPSVDWCPPAGASAGAGRSPAVSSCPHTGPGGGWWSSTPPSSTSTRRQVRSSVDLFLYVQTSCICSVSTGLCIDG